METVEVVRNQPQIPPKQENWEEDRLTALPDCLLLQILCRLPSTKDAIRTGTLSKRWKCLWTLLPTLVFNHYDDNPPWSDFVSFVDKTLAQCRQLKLKKFELYTSSYDMGFESQVNNWIHYAIGCNVEELILTLWNMESEDEFLVDQSFFINSCFTDLRLSGCILNPTGALSWKNLRRLSISDRYLHEKLIEKILSGSPVLETLVLDRCYGYKRLDITSKSVKNLVFSGYDCDSDSDDDDDLIESIEINAPNILSLTIQGTMELWKVLLVNVSSLVEANLDYQRRGHWEARRKEAEEEMLKGFILNLCHVKELKIGGLCSKVVSRLEAKGFDFPSNVKFLGVADDTDSGESESDWSDSDQSDSDWCDDDDSVEGDWSESEGFGFPSNMKFLGIGDDDDSGESNWYDSDSVESIED